MAGAVLKRGDRGGSPRTARVRLLAIVAAVSVACGAGAYLLSAAGTLENECIGLRFSLRPTTRPTGIVVVGIDNRTLDTLHMRWPFPRSVDARALDVLHADRAHTIVYDVQFTQPTTPSQDMALYSSVARARGVILATTEIGPKGTTDVLGGDANLAAADAKAAAANFQANSGGVIQRYAYSIGGLKTIGVAAAEAASGHPVARSSFDRGSAWIDFPGPVGQVPTVSFSDLLAGKVPASRIAGKIVVIGATSPVLQDVHATSVTASNGMPGPEVQAASILTALAGNPLRDAPPWLALLTILLAGVATPLLCMRLQAGRAVSAGLLLALAYGLGVQLAFDANLILVLVYPLLALAIGVLGTLVVSYLGEAWERQLAERYRATLEADVRERTRELRETQLEVIHRLALAAELRDEETGLHIERVGRICERLALQAGMSPLEAEDLRIASALHDVGKIGVPDRILLKPDKLDAGERALMKTHTLTGAKLLSSSRSPLIQMAETIAASHHECWDGSGYPHGLHGEQIPLVGRICAIGDMFDALSAARPYKQAWPFDRVVQEIARQRGTHFDPRLVDAFLAIVPELQREHANAADGPPSIDRDARALRPMPDNSTPVGVL